MPGHILVVWGEALLSAAPAELAVRSTVNLAAWWGCNSIRCFKRLWKDSGSYSTAVVSCSSVSPVCLIQVGHNRSAAGLGDCPRAPAADLGWSQSGGGTGNPEGPWLLRAGSDCQAPAACIEQPRVLLVCLYVGMAVTMLYVCPVQGV